MVERHRRDALGVALAVLNRIAGARLVQRFGLNKPIERGVYQATRTGFRTLGAATRTFQAAQRLGQPARLEPAPERGLFDLTPDDEQQMIRDTVA